MELRNKVLHALKWSAASKLLGQLITWGMTILIIRMLSPEDYGLMAIALLFINFMVMFSELGLGAVIVQRKELDEVILKKIFGLLIIANILLFALLFSSAGSIAWFFEDDRLTLLIQVLALQFLIISFELVPMALLERELELKKKSIVQLIGQVSGGVIALSCAYAGLGVWSLVWAALGDATVRAIGMNIVRPTKIFPSFSFRGMKDALAFGGFVTGERMLWFGYNQSDILIVGKILDKTSLGIYSVSMHLSSLIMYKTGEVLYTVAFPAFAKVQSDKQAVKQYFLKSVRILSICVFPIFFGMAAVAEEMITVLLGEKWLEAIPIFFILCLIMPLRMMSNIFPPLLQGIGKPGISMKNLAVAVIVMPIAFLIGSQWGTIGIAYSWVVAFPIVIVAMVHNCVKEINVTMLEFFREMARPAIVATIMFFCINYLSFLLDSLLSDLVSLILLVLVGGLVYVLFTWVIFRAGFDEVFDLIKNR